MSKLRVMLHWARIHLGEDNHLMNMPSFALQVQPCFAQEDGKDQRQGDRSVKDTRSRQSAPLKYGQATADPAAKTSDRHPTAAPAVEGPNIQGLLKYLLQVQLQLRLITRRRQEEAQVAEVHGGSRGALMPKLKL